MKPLLFVLFFKRVGAAVFTTWLALILLLVIFETFRFSNDFAFFTALGIALAAAPQFSMETLPFACAIGATLAFQKMDSANEMAVLKNAGLSPRAMTTMTMAATAVFLLLYIFISEVLLPPATQISRNLRNETTTLHGIWLKNGGDYIHIQKILSAQDMQDVTIYETDEQSLQKIITAARATHADVGWTLHDITVYDNTGARLREDSAVRLQWDDFALAPEHIAAFTRKPRYMATHEAFAAARRFESAGQNAIAFEQVVWRRWMTMPALPLLAVTGLWFVGAYRRKKNMLVPVVLATVIAAGFFFLTRISINFALLTDTIIILPLPLIALVALAVLFARR